MMAVFGGIEDDFSGESRSRTVYSQTPESHLNSLLRDVRERFDVRVGCYPMEDRRRIQLVSENENALVDAYDWLVKQPEVNAPSDKSAEFTE